MHEGTISKVIVDRGFCFISLLDRNDVFCHCSQLCGGLEWSDQLQGQRVTFDIEATERGERAANVRAA